MTEQDLLDLKADIDRSKSEAAKLEGKLQHINEEFSKWKCKNIEEAELKLSQLQNLINSYTTQINTELEKLEKEINVLTTGTE